MRARLVGGLMLVASAFVGTAYGEGVDVAALEAEVRATETAFAKTMADRDHAAFTKFLAPETIFFGGSGATRTASAVAAAWKPYFEGEKAPFSWAPEEVAVLETGDLALSSGPVYAPDGSRAGTFTSVWRHQADGSWKIVLDKGCPPCRCGQGGP